MPPCLPCRVQIVLLMLFVSCNFLKLSDLDWQMYSDFLICFLHIFAVFFHKNCSVQQLGKKQSTARRYIQLPNFAENYNASSFSFFFSPLKILFVSVFPPLALPRSSVFNLIFCHHCFYWCVSARLVCHADILLPLFLQLHCCLTAFSQSTSKADVCSTASAQWRPFQTQPLAEKHCERGTEVGRSGHTWASTAKGMRFSGAAGLKHLTASQAADEDKFLTFLQTCGFWL